jgi:7-carboxy-7-deazaguanine synthase
MSKIKVSELFYSIQGEGRYMGVPSVFLRTFGCNFTCDGFGMKRGEKSNERHAVNAKSYKSYSDLPLVSTGCDSYASWDVRFKHLSPYYNTDKLAERIVDILPYKEWRDEHLVITGGEPLLGWQRAYPSLLDQPCMNNLKEITFETNGSQELSDELFDYLISWQEDKNISLGRGYDSITFSVSAKLSVSGEKREEAIRPNTIVQYQQLGHTYLKFVIASNEDMEEVLEVTDLYRSAGFTGNVYVMPVGGVESVYSLNNRTVAELAMKYGLRYSDRIQVPLFKNAWGT